MNKTRKNSIKEVKLLLYSLRLQLEKIRDTEQGIYDNIPENLQGSEKAEESETSIEEIDEAIVNIDEAIDHLEEIV